MIPELLTILGLAIVTGAIAWVALAINHHVHQRASLRRVEERFYPHRCPTCGILHGGLSRARPQPTRPDTGKVRSY
jgi:hypothetical protein